MVWDTIVRPKLLALFYGDQDLLAAEQDVGWLYIQLPNAVEKYKVRHVACCMNILEHDK